MHAQLLMECGGSRVDCGRERAKRRGAQRLRARMALAVVALAAVAASAYGERWVLRDAPLPALEYMAATCVAHAVQDEQPSGACTSHEQDPEREDHE